MKKLLFIISVIMITVSCTNKDGATKALLDAGYKPIEVGGYGWFEGSDNDFYKTKFKAYAPNDSTRVVEGVVCSGFWFKSSTIRTN